MTDFMKSRNMEEDMAQDRHLWRLEVDGQSWKNQVTDFMKSRNMEEDMA